MNRTFVCVCGGQDFKYEICEVVGLMISNIVFDCISVEQLRLWL